MCDKHLIWNVYRVTSAAATNAQSNHNSCKIMKLLYICEHPRPSPCSLRFSFISQNSNILLQTKKVLTPPSFNKRVAIASRSQVKIWKFIKFPVTLTERGHAHTPSLDLIPGNVMFIYLFTGRWTVNSNCRSTKYFHPLISRVVGCFFFFYFRSLILSHFAIINCDDGKHQCAAVESGNKFTECDFRPNRPSSFYAWNEVLRHNMYRRTLPGCRRTPISQQCPATLGVLDNFFRG